MSQTRRENREHIRKQNKGGFYKGMPGVFLDKSGNRRMYEIAISPQGEIISRMGADPAEIRACLREHMKTSPITRTMIVTLANEFMTEKEKADRNKNRWQWLNRIWKAITTRKPKTTSKLSDEQYEALLDELDKEDDPDIVQLPTHQSN